MSLCCMYMEEAPCAMMNNGDGDVCDAVCSGFCHAVNTSIADDNGDGALVTECRPLCSTFCDCEVREEECLVCCEEAGLCTPFNNTIFLATGSPCSAGVCINVSLETDVNQWC